MFDLLSVLFCLYLSLERFAHCANPFEIKWFCSLPGTIAIIKIGSGNLLNYECLFLTSPRVCNNLETNMAVQCFNGSHPHFYFKKQGAYYQQHVIIIENRA